MIRARLLLLIALLSLIGEAYATVKVSDSTDGLNPMSDAQIFEDKSLQSTWAGILSGRYQTKFVPSPNPRPGYGYTHAIFWVKFDVQNTEDHPLNLVLKFDQAAVDDITVKIQSEHPRTYRTGDHFPFSTRPIDDRVPAFPFRLAAGERAEVWLRIDSVNNIDLAVSLYTKKYFAAYQQRDAAIVGVVAGAMLTLILYNFFLFLFTGDRTFLYYCGYMFLFQVNNMELAGTAAQLFWSNNVWMNNKGLLIINIFTVVAALQFIKSYFDTATSYKRFHLVITTIQYFELGLAASQLFLPLSYGLHMAPELLVFAALTPFVLAITALRKGYTPARYFLTAWSVLLLTVISAALARLRLMPDFFLDVRVLQGAGVIEGLLLSLALANRLQQMRRQLAHYSEHLEQLVDDKTAQLSRQVDLKSRFLARMSHEIRTPISGILGALSYVKREPLSDRANRLVRQATAAGESLLHIVSDVLEMTRLERDDVVLKSRPTDLHELAQATVSLVSFNQDETQVQYAVDIEPGVPKWISCDETRVRQVLFNLLGNASKFTREGKIILRMRSLESAGDTVAIEFAVIDTGIGIDSSRLKFIFDDFVQANDQVREHYGGSGLGLAISRQLVDALGGELHCESEVGRGSIFSFVLQLGTVLEPENRGPTHSIAEGGAAEVLVVEDDDLLREILVGQLLDNGYHPTTVATAEAALRLCQARSYDVLLTDLRLPLMDGCELARQIRQIERFKAVPLIAVTADLMPEVEARCIASGFDRVLPKPFDPEDLTRALKRQVTLASESDDRLIDLPRLQVMRSGLGAIEFDGLMEDFKASMLTFFTAAMSDDGTTSRELHRVAGRASGFCFVALGRELALAEREARAGMSQGVRQSLSRARKIYQESLAELVG